MVEIQPKQVSIDYAVEKYNIPRERILYADTLCPGLIEKQNNKELINVDRLGLAMPLNIYEMRNKGFRISNNFPYYLNRRFHQIGWKRISTNPEIVFLCEAVFYWKNQAERGVLNKRYATGKFLQREFIDYSQNGDQNKDYSSTKIKKEIQHNLKRARGLIKQFSNSQTNIDIEHRLYIDQIWEQFHKTFDNYYRNLLIEHYRVLVKYVAERLHSKLPDKVQLDDLISTGIFGLIDSINDFNPNLGVKFETYCVPRIKGSILDELRRMDWVPRLVRARAHQLAKTTYSLETLLDREPTDGEIAEELNMEMDKFNRLKRDANITTLISLDDEPNNNENEIYPYGVDAIRNRKIEDPFIEAQKRNLKNLLTKGLTRAERLIIVLYYYEEMTMEEIGRVLDLTGSRVSQLHKSIIARIKAKMYGREEEMLGRQRITKYPYYKNFSNVIIHGIHTNNKDIYRYVTNKIRNDPITEMLIESRTYRGGKKGYKVHSSNIEVVMERAEAYAQECKRKMLEEKNRFTK